MGFPRYEACLRASGQGVEKLGSPLFSLVDDAVHIAIVHPHVGQTGKDDQFFVPSDDLDIKPFKDRFCFFALFNNKEARSLLTPVDREEEGIRFLDHVCDSGSVVNVFFPVLYGFRCSFGERLIDFWVMCFETSELGFL